MNKLSQIIVSSLFLCVSSVFADIERVSLSPDKMQGDGRSELPAISEDGRYIAFSSRASNLVAGDLNYSRDIFVYDKETRTTELISVSSTGVQGNSESSFPSISANGRFVAFSSIADNLVNDDTNNSADGRYGIDIFVHDRVTGITERVNVNSNGEQAINDYINGVQLNNNSYTPSISADGRYVAFVSNAFNLVENDTNEVGDIYVHDRESGVTERVNVSTSGAQDNASRHVQPGGPQISADGRYVAFHSTGDTLIQNDTNLGQDVFIHDREAKITERVSVSSSGMHALYNQHQRLGPHDISVSADGRIVAFTSRSHTLVDGDTNAGSDIFVHDRETGTTERVNLSSTGEQAFDDSPAFRKSDNPSISADGRFVAFISVARNLVANDTNDFADVFIHDRETGITKRLNVSSNGEQGNNLSDNPRISANGGFLAFSSFASNLDNDLLDGDTNNLPDIFVAQNTLLNRNPVTVSKLINNEARNTRDLSAQLAVGTLYKQSYQVSNNSQNRIYRVQVFEDGNLVCNFYSLEAGETKERCKSFNTVIEGDQYIYVNLRAIFSDSNQVVTASTDAYYTGLNVTGRLVVTHHINNINADTVDQAQTLNTQPSSVLFKVENIGDIELYQVKTYHDPVSPMNSGWDLQCVLGPMKPSQVRYCKKDLTLNDSGLNQAMGRVQGRNSIRSATDVVNASNPTYFIVP